MNFEIPEGYSIISEEELNDAVRQSAQPVKFMTAGVVKAGELLDIHYEGPLVDCN